MDRGRLAFALGLSTLLLGAVVTAGGLAWALLGPDGDAVGSSLVVLGGPSGDGVDEAQERRGAAYEGAFAMMLGALAILVGALVKAAGEDWRVQPRE